MRPSLALVSEPGDDARERLDVALIADRIGWEEKAILAAARERGARAEWLNDGELCCGEREHLPAAGAYLIRSRSFVRGPLIAAARARHPRRHGPQGGPRIARERLHFSLGL